MMEKTLIRRVNRWFTDSGQLTCIEVPLGSKRIDLVSLNLGTEAVTAVEGKISDWRSGLLQALPYRLCADYVYLAVDERFAHRVDRKACSRYGVGVLAVNGTASVSLKAFPSKVIHRSLHEEVRSFVERVSRVQSRG